MQKISVRVGIIGIGNCASALIQGVASYNENSSLPGIIHHDISGYLPSDVEFVLGVDVDARKVGKDISDAIFSRPNNTTVFFPNVPESGHKVIMGTVLDGVADHMAEAGEDGFIVCEQPQSSKEQIVAAFRDAQVDILVNFLPVGSQQATEFYMECALEARVGVVNCIPVFVASDKGWEERFLEQGLPIIGDDIKAQIGATIVHRRLSQLFAARGVNVERTYQLNTGGNTDFMNMMDGQRLGDKRTSKTQAVQSALEKRLEDKDITIGPSEFVPWQKDNKVCFLRLEGEQWGGVPMNLELRLSVEDSPNAAACVLDSIRYCKAALDRGWAGTLTAPSAFYCKHPPEQMDEQFAQAALSEFDAALLDAAE